MQCLITFDCAVKSEFLHILLCFCIKKIYWKWDKGDETEVKSAALNLGVNVVPTRGINILCPPFLLRSSLVFWWQAAFGSLTEDSVPWKDKLYSRSFMMIPSPALPCTSCERFTALMMETPQFAARASKLPEEGCFCNCGVCTEATFISAVLQLRTRRRFWLHHIYTLIKITKWWQ